MGDTTFALDALARSLHAIDMRSEAEIREALRARLDAKAIRQTDIAAALGVQQPNAQKLFTPDKNGKLRRISYDEGVKLIEKFGLACDSPPTAREISEEGLGRLLHALAPSFPDSDASELGARALAGALKYALELLRETDANEPTDREISLAARAAISRYRAGDAA